MSIDEHPTVLAIRARPQPQLSAPLSATWLKQLAREHGADDAGLVDLERPALDDQRALIKQVYGDTRALLAFVVRMNREPVRSAVRSVANQEFHATYDAVNEVARDIVRALTDGQIGSADVTLQAATTSWLQIANRELSTKDALAEGKLQVSGPLDLLWSLAACFPHLL